METNKQLLCFDISNEYATISHSYVRMFGLLRLRETSNVLQRPVFFFLFSFFFSFFLQSCLALQN